MFVGLDVGYGQTKLSYAARVGLRKDLVWPSGAAEIDRCDTRTLASATGTLRKLVSGVEVDVDGKRYGALMPPDAIMGGMPYLHEDYPATKEYKALATAAISHVPTTRIDVLVTGLPVSHQMDPNRRESLKARLRGRHAVGGRTVEVVRVEVVPQGLGAYIATNDVSSQATSKYDTVLVVDVGHYSVDWVLVSGGHWRKLGSGSSFDGAHTILKAAASIIHDETGLKVSPARIMSMVLDGSKKALLGGREVDVANVLSRAAGGIVPRVTSGVRSALSDGAEVTAVIMTGGGAGYYKQSLIEAFPNASHIAHSNPALANAIGFQALAEHFGKEELRA